MAPKQTLTDTDIQTLKQIFATKDDFKELRNDIIEFKDEILGEIQDLRDDVAIVTSYKDTIEDHDQRIENLEQHTGLSPSQ